MKFPYIIFATLTDSIVLKITIIYYEQIKYNINQKTTFNL